MRRLPRPLLHIFVAVLYGAGAAGLGLAVNALRGGALAWVAPFPYDHDCPEKIDLSTPTVDAARAFLLSKSRRVRGPGGSLGAVFVDSRPEEAYAASHLRGARSYPYSFVTPFSPADAAALHRFAHVFVYCDSPDDRLAKIQAEQMRKQGLKRIKIVKGGWAALARAAGPSAIARATRPAAACDGGDGGAAVDARGER